MAAAEASATTFGAASSSASGAGVSGAGAAWTGPALASLVAGLQTLQLISTLPRPGAAGNATTNGTAPANGTLAGRQRTTTLSADGDGDGDGDDAPPPLVYYDACSDRELLASDAAGLGLDWTNLQAPRRQRPIDGANPVGYFNGVLAKKHKHFRKAMTLVCVALAVLSVGHYVAVVIARRKVNAQHRQEERQRHIAKRFKLKLQGGTHDRKAKNAAKRRHHGHHSTIAHKLKNGAAFVLGMGRGAGHYDAAARRKLDDADYNRGETPPGLLEKFSHTSPRITHYAVMLVFQAVCTQCSYHITKAPGSVGGVFALLVFLCVPVGFLVYTAYTIRQKVRCSSSPFCWCDRSCDRSRVVSCVLTAGHLSDAPRRSSGSAAPCCSGTTTAPRATRSGVTCRRWRGSTTSSGSPTRSQTSTTAARHITNSVARQIGGCWILILRGALRLCGFAAGFVDSYGALVEDFKASKGRVYALVALLLHRLVVGVVAGAAVAPDEDASRRQITALCAAFAAHLVLLAAWRPFIVPCATLCEALLVAMQLACVPVERFCGTLFFRSNAPRVAQLRPWMLIPAECSAVLLAGR